MLSSRVFNHQLDQTHSLIFVQDLFIVTLMENVQLRLVLPNVNAKLDILVLIVILRVKSGPG